MQLSADGQGRRSPFDRDHGPLLSRGSTAITVGWKPDGRRDRITVRGRTKTEVKDKLRAKTLNTQAESTVTGYRIMVGHLLELIGNVKLVELKERDVDFALGKLAKRLSTRSVRLARMILIHAIRNAMVNDLVVRNVADLAAVPTGKPGRPSRSLNLEQAVYRHQFRPVTRTAGIALGPLFESRGKTDGGRS